MSDTNYFQKANVAYNQGNYKEALELYKEAIKKKDNVKSSFYNAGVCYMKFKEYLNALKLIKSALEFGNQSSEVYFNIGYCYIMLDDAKNAYLNFNIAWSLNNKDKECEKAIKIAESIVCNRSEKND